ncbi:Uncharacterised protein [BD1-7 clade bacterium]|uniref:Periplasmic protein CpxP n=1 Tax=BD1-7 clade bacterium TaxID=2029982 RepID=A0A5S9PTN2_9GAMM|nr:Uncharacterised protein [BD1-7 clade bacterium]
MNKTLKTLTAVTLSAGLLLGTGAAMAKPGHGGHGDNNYRAYFNQEVLQLTSEQRDEIKTIVKKAKTEGRAQREAHRQVSIAKLDPTAADYQTQVEAIADAKAAMVKQRILKQAQVRADIYQILTPEQREKMLKLDEYRGKQKGKHHHGEKHQRS